MAERIDLSNYKLVFSDDFNTLRLHGEPGGGLWRTEGYWGSRTLPGNGERQYYVDPKFKDLGLNPFSVTDGVLTIRAERAGADIKPLIENLDYTSGQITSERSFSMQYGYFEIRAEMPAGKGLWPAFWMLALDGQWPPEIDVIEVLGHEPDKLYGTFHWKDPVTGKQLTSGAANVKGMFDSSDGFHTYGVDWQQDKITWYFDGVKVGETANTVFDQPMYLIANLAVGGYWPGNPDSTTSFPADMKIDWIRAYQKAADHPIVTVPKNWAPMGMEVFTPMAADGAKTVWDWRYTMAAGETKAALGGTWARYLNGNDGDNYLGGSYAPYNELLGGRGNDTMKGGYGSDVFIIRDGDGNDVILDLTNTVGNTDKIRLEGFHFRHFDDVRPFLTRTGGDVILRLDVDQALLLKNTTIDALSPEMFVFTNPVAPPVDATETTGTKPVRTKQPHDLVKVDPPTKGPKAKTETTSLETLESQNRDGAPSPGGLESAESGHSKPVSAYSNAHDTEFSDFFNGGWKSDFDDVLAWTPPRKPLTLDHMVNKPAFTTLYPDHDHSGPQAVYGFGYAASTPQPDFHAMELHFDAVFDRPLLY